MQRFQHLADFDRYINIPEGLGRIRGNQKLYKTLLQTFLKSTYLDQLNEQLAAGNLSEVAGSAHAVKGMAANLSLTALQQSAANLEAKLKAGEHHAQEAEAFASVWTTTFTYVTELVSALEQGPLSL